VSLSARIIGIKLLAFYRAAIGHKARNLEWAIVAASALEAYTLIHTAVVSFAGSVNRSPSSNGSGKRAGAVWASSSGGVSGTFARTGT
jgi:hypothetical protein